MSIELDPREVLLCLNELGYCNINSKQLKEFLKDLKTLIKYDRKKIKENEENICPNLKPSHNESNKTQNNNYEYDLDDFQKQTNLCTNDTNASEVFDHLYSTSTISSRAKSVTKHNSIIAIDIKKAKNSSQSSSTTLYPKHSDNKIHSDVSIGSKSALQSNAPNFDLKSKIFCSDQNLSKKGNSFKPKVSFIKPRKQLKLSKSDPVNLYQQYQNEWKKQKLPGEDKRYDLRWAIRERMLGEPVLPVRSTDRLSKKSNRF